MELTPFAADSLTPVSSWAAEHAIADPMPATEKKRTSRALEDDRIVSDYGSIETPATAFPLTKSA
jgi:hypothetical protein